MQSTLDVRLKSRMTVNERIGPAMGNQGVGSPTPAPFDSPPFDSPAYSHGCSEFDLTKIRIAKNKVLNWGRLFR